jgi:CheY-like chemotaxis protein
LKALLLSGLFRHMGKKIFLVEDAEDVREMYGIALRAEHQVETAIDGQEAVDKLMQKGVNYDLILLDVMLPKLDGISVLRKIKQENSPSKDIPVFLFTNLGMNEVIEEAEKLGAVRCMVKANVLPQNILEEVDNYFANPNAPAPKKTTVITSGGASQTPQSTQAPNAQNFPVAQQQTPLPTAPAAQSAPAPLQAAATSTQQQPAATVATQPATAPAQQPAPTATMTPTTPQTSAPTSSSFPLQGGGSMRGDVNISGATSGTQPTQPTPTTDEEPSTLNLDKF